MPERFADPGAPRSDAELINMAMHIFCRVGLTDVTLNINSLGCASCRGAFKNRLRGFLADKKDALCGECQRRAELNPLRVFDCKIDQKDAQDRGSCELDNILSDECKNQF
jgi:histidyl-tRNA synthetase